MSVWYVATYYSSWLMAAAVDSVPLYFSNVTESNEDLFSTPSL